MLSPTQITTEARTAPVEDRDPGRGVVAAVADDALAHRVVQTASDLALRLGLPLTLVHSPDPDALLPPEAYREALERGHAFLDRVATGHPEAGQIVQAGDPADLVGNTAREGASLIVVGNRGRGGLKAALLGSLSQKVAREARVPVVVVPAHLEPPTGGPVAVAFETTAVSDDAARVAAELALRFDTRLAVIHLLANPRSYPAPDLAMQRAARSAVDSAVSADDLEVAHATTYRRPAGALDHRIEAIEPAMLVVGAARRPRWRELLRPSVAAELLRRATHPVVVVPTGAELRPVGPSQRRDGVAAGWSAAPF